jgi:hypothetical protein
LIRSQAKQKNKKFFDMLDKVLRFSILREPTDQKPTDKKKIYIPKRPRARILSLFVCIHI